MKARRKQFLYKLKVSWFPQSGDHALLKEEKCRRYLNAAVRLHTQKTKLPTKMCAFVVIEASVCFPSDPLVLGTPAVLEVFGSWDHLPSITVIVLVVSNWLMSLAHAFLLITRIMILINLVVLHHGTNVGRVLGTPSQIDLVKVVPNGHSAQPYPPASSNPPAMAPKPHLSTETASHYGRMTARPGGGEAFSGTPVTTPSTRSPMGGSSGGRGNIYPIASLNPYQNK